MVKRTNFFFVINHPELSDVYTVSIWEFAQDMYYRQSKKMATDTTSVVRIGDVIYIIASVLDTVHPQLRILLTKSVVTLVLPVVLVWIHLQ
jgi:hypothetical protein